MLHFLAVFGVRNAEWLALTGLVVTFAGVWLQWNLQWKRSDAEEALKDGKISAEAASRRIRRLGVLAPAICIAGMLMLVLAAVKLFN